MDIIENRPYVDSIEDGVPQKLREIIALEFKGKYRQLKKDFEAYLQSQGGDMYPFRRRSLGLNRINESVLIKIGPKKRGFLHAFRGHWVRVIEFSSYGYTMYCLVQKVNITTKMEKKLIPRGPYTKDEFTDEVSKCNYLKDAVVDGAYLVRSNLGIWISGVPTDRALLNLEKDEIPDGIIYIKHSEENGEWDYEKYHKFGGYWIMDTADASEVRDGKLDWVPVGATIQAWGWLPNKQFTILIKTKDGWVRADGKKHL